MIINKKMLDELSTQAKVSPRLKMDLDLWNSPKDMSKMMQNALEIRTLKDRFGI